MTGDARGEARVRTLQQRFERHVRRGIPGLKNQGYNPTLFIRMINEYGAVGAAKRLLANADDSSPGFTTLWEMRQLDASVEYAVCLPWFGELFTDEERERARRRLERHEFPLARRLAAEAPPDWYREL